MAQLFTVDLTGTQEVPPNASAASGTGTVVWDPATTTATYEFVVNGLDFGPALGLVPQTETTADDVTAMHFHNAVPGVAGPVVFGQLGPAQDADALQVSPNDDGSWTISGVWETTDPASVPITNYATVLDSTPVGSDTPLYWNVHTTAFPEGEIRGQLVAAEDSGTGDTGGTADTGTDDTAIMTDIGTDATAGTPGPDNLLLG